MWLFVPYKPEFRVDIYIWDKLKVGDMNKLFRSCIWTERRTRMNNAQYVEGLDMGFIIVHFESGMGS